MRTLFEFLRQATKNFPPLRFVWGVLGIVAAVAIASNWIDLRIAVFGGVIFLYLMIALLLFRRAVSGAQADLNWPARIQVWAAMILVNGSAFVAASSVLFDYPRLFRPIVVPNGPERPVPFSDSRVALNVAYPDDTAIFANLSAGASDGQKKVVRMSNWMRWMVDGARPRAGDAFQLVLVEQIGAFDRDYSSFTAAIIDTSNVIQIEKASAFLVGRDSLSGSAYEPAYRPMDFRRNKESPCTVTLESPRKGERLLMLMTVKSRKADVSLPLKAGGYGFYLEKQ